MRLFLVFSFLLLSSSLTGTGNGEWNVIEEGLAYQDPRPLEFSREELSSLREDPAFDYRQAPEEENWWTRFKRYIRLQWQNFLDWLLGGYEASGFMAVLLELLPYLLLAIVVSFLIYLMARLNPLPVLFGENRTGVYEFDEETQIVRQQNIQKLIEEAVHTQSYRLAVRYHFLYILKQLDEKGLVEYSSSKTDEDYLKEISEEPLREQFKKINRIYDFVWYGNFEIGEQGYRRIKSEFDKAAKLLEV